MPGDGVGVNDLSKSKDNCRLDSNVAKDAATMEGLSGDTDRSNLSHLLSTVGHPFIHQSADLQAKLLDQVVIQVGGVGCREVWRLKDGEWPPLNNQNVFSYASSKVVGEGCCFLHCWFKFSETVHCKWSTPLA